MLHFFLRNIHRPILSDPVLGCFSDRSIRSQDAQRGQPTRPQEARAPRRTWWVYVEGLERPRTTWGAFFSIILRSRFSPSSLVDQHLSLAAPPCGRPVSVRAL